MVWQMKDIIFRDHSPAFIANEGKERWANAKKAGKATLQFWEYRRL
jgi:hypothetical protein